MMRSIPNVLFSLACIVLPPLAQAWELSGTKTITAITRDQTVRAGDFAWLEHHLLFLYKQPRDFGAKLWNGVYYRLVQDAQGLMGLPQAVDLNLISAPPDDLTTPPYGREQRDDLTDGARWIARLLIR